MQCGMERPGDHSLTDVGEVLCRLSTVSLSTANDDQARGGGMSGCHEKADWDSREKKKGGIVVPGFQSRVFLYEKPKVAQLESPAGKKMNQSVFQWPARPLSRSLCSPSHSSTA